MSEENNKPQKVKLVGTLYTIRQVVSLIRDFFLLFFVLAAVGALFMIGQTLSQINLPF